MKLLMVVKMLVMVMLMIMIKTVRCLSSARINISSDCVVFPEKRKSAKSCHFKCVHVLNTSKLYKVHEPHQRFVLKHSLILTFPFLSSLLWCSNLQKFLSPGSNILLLFWLMIFSLVSRYFCFGLKCVRFCFCCCLFLFVVCTCILLPCPTRCSFIDVLSCTPTGVSEINYLTCF